MLLDVKTGYATATRLAEGYYDCRNNNEFF
jgi:hypothetical protein